jgi:DNA-binding HxlR family transcriptional regulator
VEIPVEVLGGKWKLGIVYHLLSGPRRNGELRRLVPGITQKILTQRLREPEHNRIVIRAVHQEVPPKVVYTIGRGEAKPLRTLMRLDQLLGSSHGSQDHPSRRGCDVVPAAERAGCSYRCMF